MQQLQERVDLPDLVFLVRVPFACLVRLCGYAYVPRQAHGLEGADTVVAYVDLIPLQAVAC